MPVSVLNTTASLSGKTLLKAEDAQTITGQKTFDLGGSAPFVCVSGAALVTHLDADLLDGQHGTDYRDGEKLTNDVRLQGFSTAALVAKQSIAGEARLSYDSTLKSPKVSIEAGKYFDIFNAVNVKQYGATGDGTTNDRAAIQAAIDAASLTVAGVVWFPNGTYKIEKAPAQVYGLLVTKAIVLRGESAAGVTLRGHGMSAAGDIVINVDGTVTPDLEQVQIVGVTIMSNDASRPDLLKWNRASVGVIRDVNLRDGRHGIIITGDRTFSLVLDHIICGTALTGTAIRFDNAAGGQFSIRDCSFVADIGVGMFGATLSLDTVVFDNCNWESCTQAASFTSAGLVRTVTFNGGRCEKNLGPFDFSPDTGGVFLGLAIHGMLFETDVEDYAINLSGAGVIAGINIKGCYAKDYADYFVRMVAGSGGEIIGNVLENIPVVVSDYRAGMLVLNNRDEAGVEMGPQWSPVWTTPAFAAGDFTANGIMTWTVAAGDVQVYAYTIIGKMMTVSFRINTTTVAGTPNTDLNIKIPASKVATKAMYNPILIIDNGVRSIGVAAVATGGTLIILNRTDVANWTAAVDTTYVMGQITFEIDNL
jgi:hypothetical protein